MSRSAVAAALAFTSSDGSTIVVAVGPNGCAVSRNQRHVGRVVDGESVLDMGRMVDRVPLSPSDLEVVRVAAVRVRRLVEDTEKSVALWSDGEETIR